MLIFEEPSFFEKNKEYLSEMDELRKLYCSPPREEYRMLMTDI